MKKKLLSVILAVAVAFTFSFAMVGTASATTTGTIKYSGTNYSTGTATTADGTAVSLDSTIRLADGTTTEETAWGWNNASSEFIPAGQMYSMVSKASYDEWAAAHTGASTELKNELEGLFGKANSGQAFYDFQGAELSGIGINADGTASFTEVTFKASTYAYNMGSTATVIKTDFETASGWTLTATLNGYDPEVTTAQKCTITLSAEKESPTGVAVPLQNLDKVTQEYTVPAKSYTVADTKFYLDEVADDNQIEFGTENNFKPVYDGASHKIVYNEVEGNTVKLEKFNKKTAEYEAVTEITYENVTEAAEYYKATVTRTDATTKEETKQVYEFSIQPQKAMVDIYAKNRVVDGLENCIDNIESIKDYINRIAIVEAKDYDSANLNALVDFEGGLNADYTGDKAEYVAASKAAVAANYDTIKAAFNEGILLEECATTNLPQIVLSDSNYSIKGIKALKAVDLTTTMSEAEKKVYLETYAELFANFDWTRVTDTNIGADAYVLLVEEKEDNTADDEVTFTKYCSVLKGYTNKTRTYTFTAESESGNAVTYKLINAPSKVKIDSATGKITVKKGMKKGRKINITVKAYTKASNGYAKASETHKFTLKIVKK